MCVSDLWKERAVTQTHDLQKHATNPGSSAGFELPPETSDDLIC